MKYLWMSVAAAAMLLTTSCKDNGGDDGQPSITVTPTELTFDSSTSSQIVQVTSNRDWTVNPDALPKWVSVNPTSGRRSGDTKVTVTVLPNEGIDRSHDLVFSIGFSTAAVKVKQTGAGGSAEEALVYFNNFDKAKAEKTYGSGNSFPYLDQFDGWKNHEGNGSANVDYDSKGMSVRSNSESNGSYSIYEGSGVNNLFFGKSAWFEIQKIAVEAKTYKISFGTEKYLQDGSKIVDFNEFKVYVSQDGAKYVNLTDWTFASGSAPEGKWDLVSTSVTLPASTSTLYIRFDGSAAASAFRIDDVKVELTSGTGTAIDWSKGVDLGGGTGGGDTPTDPTYPTTQPTLVKVSVSEFLAKPVNETDWYELTGKITNIANADYGNFTIEDATGSVYVYGLTSKWIGAKNDKSFSTLGLKVGDTVTFGTLRQDYNGTAQAGGKWCAAFYLSHVPGEGGDNPGGGDETGGIFTSNVTITTDEALKSYSQKSDVTYNGKTYTGVATYKFGTSKVVGSATATIPAGVKKVTYWGLSWKDKAATLAVKLGDTEVYTQDLAANAGLTSTPPYKVTVTDSDKYVLDVTKIPGCENGTPAEVTLTLTSTGTNKRFALFGVVAE